MDRSYKMGSGPNQLQHLVPHSPTSLAKVTPCCIERVQTIIKQTYVVLWRIYGEGWATGPSKIRGSRSTSPNFGIILQHFLNLCHQRPPVCVRMHQIHFNLCQGSIPRTLLGASSHKTLDSPLCAYIISNYYISCFAWQSAVVLVPGTLLVTL